MKRLALVVSLLVTTSAFAQAKMKAGLWEVKTLKHLVDGRDLQAQFAAHHSQMGAAQDRMAEAMAKLTPEQRQRMEAAMGGKGMGPNAMNPAAAGMVKGSEPGTIRVCLSEAMVAKDRPMVDPEAKCEPAKINRSGDKMSFEFNCSRDGRTTKGKGENVISGNTVRSTVEMTSTDSMGTHTMQRESVMTFIAADCGEVKPLDQLKAELKTK